MPKQAAPTVTLMATFGVWRIAWPSTLRGSGLPEPVFQITGDHESGVGDRSSLRKLAIVLKSIVTDRHRAYDAALRDLGLSHVHRRGKQLNNRAESSYVLIRRRELSISRIGARFFSSHSTAYNTFNICRHLTTVSAGMLRLMRCARSGKPVGAAGG